MPLELQRTHVFKQDRDGTDRLVETNFSLRLMAEGAPYPVFIQHGEMYGEGGEAIHDVPDWLWSELDKVSPEALAAVGFCVPARSMEAMPRPRRASVAVPGASGAEGRTKGHRSRRLPPPVAQDVLAHVSPDGPVVGLPADAS